MKRIQDVQLTKVVGGMPCSQLYGQLADMIGQGGNAAAQAGIILNMMAAGYHLCD